MNSYNQLIINMSNKVHVDYLDFNDVVAVIVEEKRMHKN